MAYTLPELGYAYDALEPHFDALTMEIHHTKHHQTYVNNANAVLESSPEAAELAAQGCPGSVLKNLNKIPADKFTAARNNNVTRRLLRRLVTLCLSSGKT